MDLYIYYRAATSAAPALQAQVALLQATLRDRHGICCGLKQRPHAVDGRDTWMEIYLAVPAGFEQTLETALAQTGLPLLIDGHRHIENFLDRLPCA